jgi:hypothetical protein
MSGGVPNNCAGDSRQVVMLLQTVAGKWHPAVIWWKRGQILPTSDVILIGVLSLVFGVF